MLPLREGACGAARGACWGPRWPLQHLNRGYVRAPGKVCVCMCVAGGGGRGAIV